jgi:hypothetical protein
MQNCDRDHLRSLSTLLLSALKETQMTADNAVVSVQVTISLLTTIWRGLVDELVFAT